MRKGKHETSGGGWRQDRDPFAEEAPSGKAGKAAAPGGGAGLGDPFAEAASSGKTGKAAAPDSLAGLGDPFAEDVPAAGTEKKTGGLAGAWKGLGKWKKAGIIAGGSVLAVILLVVGWWSLFVKAPDVSDNDRPITGLDSAARPVGAGNSVEDKDGSEAASGRKEDVYTFILLGKDTAGGGNTDTMILVTYDVPNATVNCMSIPRDTMVNVSWDIKRINSVYMAKESSGGGIEGVKKQVGLLTGVTPDFYVIIEWKAVGLLVDALGGVEFDVPYNMNYDDPYQDLHIHQSKGLRTLSGSDAMQIVRFRGYNGGDVKRVEVQQLFLKAVAKQCLQLKNWTKISDFAKIFFENVETDIPLNNLLWFAQKAMNVDLDNLDFVTMPGNYEGYAWSRTAGGNQSYVFAYPEEIVKLVNESFNPYSRDITEDDLQIMYKNKNGSLGVTNGTVLDGRSVSASSSGSSGGSGSSGTSSSSGSSSGSGISSGSGTSNSSGSASSSGTSGGSGSSGTSGGSGSSGTSSGSGTTNSSGEPALPATPSEDPGAETNTTPGTTAGPGTEENPGTVTEPGTQTAPEAQPPEGGGSDPEPEPAPQPETPPDPAPELPPEPGLPPGE